VFLAGGAGDWSIETLERTAPARLPMLAGDTAALYLLSSGTTGLPKIVPHTHAELLADGRRTSTAWGLAPDDIVFDMLPGNFAMGLLLGLTNALEAGATTVYWSDPRPLVLARRALLDALIAEKVTVMGAVPAMYDALAGTPGDSRPATIRLAFSGGAALRRATYDAMRERFGIRLRQSYGSTEAIFVAHNDAPDVDRLWDSVGRPVGDAEVRLAPTDAAFGPGVGELLIRSSSVTSGYLDDPEANGATFFEDGWLRSGDLARIDPAGNLFIVGRSKLLIEISGFKIDPIEVEETLRLHPAVAEAVVVGARRSPRAEAQLKAFVVRQDDVSADSLIRFVRERLSAQKVPAAIEFVETLPRSSAGKILRSKLGEGV
ncbi:MAG TPA: acyl--CoA ligase, partial [Alphaproteobacteria bacterium]|nr:acyl--CoA ligase [Alphaproteobacteria bacterium]